MRKELFNPKWNLILQTIDELDRQGYALKVNRFTYNKICYVLTRYGVEMGFNFKKGFYGPYSIEAQNSIGILSNANLITERHLGEMISIEVNDGFKFKMADYTAEELRAVNVTADLFGRVKNTEQAEMAATVIYAYDELAKTNNIVDDKEVLDYVMDWKPRWLNKEFEVADNIANLAMMGLIKARYTGQLPDGIGE